MEFDILDALDDIGDSVSSLNVKDNKQRCNFLNEDKFACLRYPGILKTDDEIVEAIEMGTKSLAFTQLVEWLSKELQALNKMESCVNALTDIEESSSFLLEVSSFLKELNCPYKSLMDGPISQRLLDVESRRTFLDYLCTELLTARMLYDKKEVKNAMEIQMDASSIASSLQNALETLGICMDSNDSEDPMAYLLEMENKIKQMLDSKSLDIEPAILTETMSDEQWESLRTLYEDFLSEYTVRRKLLITRLEVTIQSFKWGEGSKGKESKIINAYIPRRKPLKNEPSVKLSDIIAAKESLLVVEKTSSADLVKNTSSSLNKVLIDAVPDRGGRPKEQRPPVEMPSWGKRTEGGGRGGYQGGSGSWRGKNKKFRGKQDRGGGDRGNNREASFSELNKEPVALGNVGSFYCKVCDKHMNSQDMWHAHVTGRKHINKLKSISRGGHHYNSGQSKGIKREASFSELNKEAMYSEKLLGNTGSYYCKVCDSHMNSRQAWHDHINGRKHNNKLERVSRGKNPKKQRTE